MLDWLYDVQVELRKELSLRQRILQGTSYDSLEKLSIMLDLWQASTFFDRNRFLARSDAVRIHAASNA